MTRFYNYSAGPSMLPLEILKKAASELVCYGSSGMSVMEMSHRSTAFEEIIHQAEASLRKLMEIPNEYAVLFLQGGATTQFSMIPMNLMTKNGKADYIVSGYFAEKAYKLLPPRKIKNIPKFLMLKKTLLIRKQIMCISAITTPYSELRLIIFPTLATYPWWRICHPILCLNLWM